MSYLKALLVLSANFTCGFDLELTSSYNTIKYWLRRPYDKTRQLYCILHDTLMTDLAPQVAKANRGGPGTIRINEICWS